jgi:hypothetical protein
MKKKLVNIIVIACFAVVTAGFMLANIATTDQDFSFSERRKLAQPPEFASGKLWSGELFEECEEYFLDQFALRDMFRGFKAYVKLFLLNQKDNNDMYIKDGHIIKIEYPLKEQSIINAAAKFTKIYQKYLQDSNVYYSVVPDKNYFTGHQNGHLSMDYDRMINLLKQNISDMEYIDIFTEIALEDYYKTDIHWSQDKIIGVADKLLKAMEGGTLASETSYVRLELSPFFGSYYGHAALNIRPDILTYLTNPAIENAVVFDFETETYSNVYVPEYFKNVDPYDVFLSGAKALITIDNPKAANDGELIIFRDSFASSLAPLLLHDYSRITMVDLRYITTDLVGEYVEFTPGSDVLFLYGTQVLNNSAMLK